MRRGFFVLMVIFFSCSDKEKTPAGVLPPEEMVKVLTELYVVENKVTRLGIKSDSAVQVFNTFKGKMFAQTGVTDSALKTSMQYYMDHPKELEAIYTALVDSLNLKEQRSSVERDQNK